MKKLLVLTFFLTACSVQWSAVSPAPPDAVAATASADCDDNTQLVYKHCHDQAALYTAALAKARANDKFLVATFGYATCPWCQSLETLFHRSGLAADLQSRLEFVEIAAYTPDLKEVVGVKAVDEAIRQHLIAGPTMEGFPFLYVIDPLTGKAVGMETSGLEKNDEEKGIWSHDPALVNQALGDALKLLSCDSLLR